jgi:ATP-dependent RNA helicase RhlB
MDLNPKLLQGIEKTGFEELMPVQEQTFVESLKGRDVTVQSQTGTGKTAAFLISIYQLFLLENGPVKQKRALIVVPTRELAVQIEKEAKELARCLDFTIGSFFGGVGYTQQERLLNKGVEIAIGTPGRLLDLNQSGKFDFKKIGVLVIDEADRMFDMGFLPDIRRIIRKMLPPTHRMTMLFSATLDERSRGIVREFMNKPAVIEIEPEKVTVEKISQMLFHVGHDEKFSILLGVLSQEKPKSTLIFTNMKHVAVQVAKHLNDNGFECDYLIGDLPQKKRLRIMGDFKAGKLPCLVATDVAARGLHIDDLELVVNFDLPGDCENYVHRIGRTARAGKSGKAISLACENYIYNLDPIEGYINMKIPVCEPEDSLFEKYKGEGIQLEKRRNNRKSRTGQSESRNRRDRDNRRSRPEKKRPSKDEGKSAAEKQVKKDRVKQEKNKQEQAKQERRNQSQKQRKNTPKTATQKKSGNKSKANASRRTTAKKTERKKPIRDFTKPRVVDPMQERLDYYKKKYGEDFKVTSGPTDPAYTINPPKKKSFFSRLLGMFKDD